MWNLFKSKEQKELEKKLKEEQIKRIEEQNRMKENNFIELYSKITNLVLPKIVDTINFEEISKLPIFNLVYNDDEKKDEIMIKDNWRKLSDEKYCKFFRIENNKEYDTLIDEFVEKHNNGSIDRIYMETEYQYEFGNYIYYMTVEFLPNITIDIENDNPFKIKKNENCSVRFNFIGKTQKIEI